MRLQHCPIDGAKVKGRQGNMKLNGRSSVRECGCAASTKTKKGSNIKKSLLFLCLQRILRKLLLLGSRGWPVCKTTVARLGSCAFAKENPHQSVALHGCADTFIFQSYRFLTHTHHRKQSENRNGCILNSKNMRVSGVCSFTTELHLDLLLFWPCSPCFYERVKLNWLFFLGNRTPKGLQLEPTPSHMTPLSINPFFSWFGLSGTNRNTHSEMLLFPRAQSRQLAQTPSCNFFVLTDNKTYSVFPFGMKVL